MTNGGGLLIYGDAPTVSGCSFVQNQSEYGGGVLFSSPNQAEAVWSLFSANTATSGGGGIYIYQGNVSIQACEIRENVAGVVGGGVRLSLGSLLLENTLLSGNEAQQGAGVGSGGAADLSIHSCTIVANDSLASGDSGGGVYNITTPLMIANSIIWGNSPTQLYDSTAAGTVRYCDIQGGYFGVGNLDATPLFVDPLVGDFHLQSGSPCIDAGDGALAPATDFDGNLRFDNPNVLDSGTGTPTYVDIGAFERQIP